MASAEGDIMLLTRKAPSTRSGVSRRRPKSHGVGLAVYKQRDANIDRARYDTIRLMSVLRAK